jgi:hypothetical protein
VSTILKALRRLEEQKAASGPRPLREEVATAPTAPETAHPRRWLPAAAIALGLGLASAAGVVLLQGDATPGADVAAEPAMPPPTPRVAVEPPARARPDPSIPAGEREPAPLIREEARGGLPEEAFASRVEVVRRPPPEPRIPIEIARAADPMPGPSPKPTASGRAKSTPAETKSESAAPKPTPSAPKRVAGTSRRSPAPVALPAEPPEEPEPVKPEPARTAKQPAPVASESKPTPAPRSAEAKPSPSPKVAEKSPPGPDVVTRPSGEAPKLQVEKTLWHPKADRRVAFIALGGEPSQRIQEGDVVGRYVVSEIQPTGVVFLSDGKPVHYGIGSSGR